MNELATGKTIAVKEVAEVLGCSEDAILHHVKTSIPQSELVRIGNGHGGKPQIMLNEEQITLIKQKMRPTTLVVGAITDMEAAEMLLKSAEHFKARFEQEHNARVDAEHRLAIAEPKAAFFDQVADSKDCLQMRDVAGVLNLPGYGRNMLFEFLRKKEVLDSRNILYRKYQDQGYFRAIEQKYTTPDGETRISLKTLVYQRGVDFIRKLIAEAA
jgi:phage antirepressor YoqD-like protein